MEDREKQIPPPKSWITFEDLCHRLFKAVWDDPLAQKNGRSGQPQKGVDVFGSPGQCYGIYHGVQCKGKEGQYGAKPTQDEIDKEIAKAELFEPALKHWVYATTAPVDATLQEAARKKSYERAKEGRFTVSVLGWGEIERLLCEHKQVLREFYPDHGFNYSELLENIRSLPQSSELRELLTFVGQYTKATGSNAIPQIVGVTWRPVIFGKERDLGPALMGRPLGPADAISCPRLPEVDIVIAELKRAFSARIVGEPGVGKSLCAYQTAKEFVDLGWNIVCLDDPKSIVIDLQALPTDVPVLFLIDDAHLTPPTALRIAEQQAGPERILLSIHNAVEGDTSFRNSVIIDAKRAVRKIASSLRSSPEITLEVVKRIDDQVGETSMTTALEDRIDYAEQIATVPWQFCFILGGGWRRIDAMVSAARKAKADIVLATVAIRQLVSRDESPSLAVLMKFIEASGLSKEETEQKIEWLAKERLLISAHDLRCPHQRFAAVVIPKVLKGQAPDGRRRIGQILQYALMDDTFPIAGQRLLLHELRFSGDAHQWTYLVPETALTTLIERCWIAESAEDRTFACLLLSELEAYIKRWPEVPLSSHQHLIGSWTSEPSEPLGHGLSRLIHSISNRDKELASAIVSCSDPFTVAKAVSAVAPKTASHLGELLSALAVTREQSWSNIFLEKLDRKKIVKFAAEWPIEGPSWAFAKFCNAIQWVDESLALDMAEQFVPVAQALIKDNPVATFRELDDILWHVLRMFDPLGVYVGKLSPKKRNREIAARMLKPINPQHLGSQLSRVRLRDFQSISFLLAFMDKAAPTKFRATVSYMDWDCIAETIGKYWSNMPHDAEVLIGVAFNSKPARKTIQELILRNLYRIEVFPPRLVLICPKSAFKHVEKGGLIRLTQHGHVEWMFGAVTIAYFAKERPELLERLLSPSEIPTGAVLSQQHHSWYKEADKYVEVLAEASPQSLQRILDSIDIKGAEIGWANALSHGGGPMRTVALLVESCIDREDKLGELAKQLRRRFPKSSIPKKGQKEQLHHKTHNKANSVDAKSRAAD